MNMKVNSNFRLFASANFDSSKYVASPSSGVNRFMLDRIGNEMARATSIVEYQPNSKFPKPTHIGGEEFLVLKGTFKDQFGEFPANTYVRNPIGSAHAPWVDEDGCTILVKLLQMADTGEGTTPLRIDLDAAKDDHGEQTAFGTVVTLYKNERTGEIVQMLWLNANKSLPTDSLCLGGEELFVIAGSLDLNANEGYRKWGWLRFPCDGDPRRASLKAGSDGAQVYRKTGHLTEQALSMEEVQVHDDETIDEK